MIKRYCQYCGLPISEGCDCERIAAEEHDRFIEEYENRPDVQAGWAFQDMCDLRRRER